MPDADFHVSVHAALLSETVREAGTLALKMFRTDLKTWTKGVSSPVSEADIAVNDLIEGRLRTATPDYGWLSEESTQDPFRLDKTHIWVVDPIDGTRAYLAGHEDWSVSIALVSGGSPVLGAVFAPVTGELYFAARGAGTTLNGSAVQASTGDTVDRARIAGPKALIGQLQQIGENMTVHPRIGSLALRLCRVADGQLDIACAGGHSQDWDLAAANLIVQEAGGEMTEINGDRLVFNRSDITHGLLLAAGRERHRRLVTYFQSNPVF